MSVPFAWRLELLTSGWAFMNCLLSSRPDVADVESCAYCGGKSLNSCMSKHQVIPLHYIFYQGIRNYNFPGLSVTWVSNEDNNLLLLYLLMSKMVQVFSDHLHQGNIPHLMVNDVVDSNWIWEIWQWWEIC